MPSASLQAACSAGHWAALQCTWATKGDAVLLSYRTKLSLCVNVQVCGWADVWLCSEGRKGDKLFSDNAKAGEAPYLRLCRKVHTSVPAAAYDRPACVPTNWSMAANAAFSVLSRLAPLENNWSTTAPWVMRRPPARGMELMARAARTGPRTNVGLGASTV
jgi:hypothetical protein